MIPNTLRGYPVTSIGDYAFGVCSSLISITIPDGVTSIGRFAFWGCSRLTSIEIPDSITRIGASAFRDCDDLSYYIYDNGKYLGTSKNPYVAMIETTSDDICSCEIHAETKLIADNAFYSCGDLISISIPDRVKAIGEDAFANCDGLMSAIIGDSVTSIGARAFYNGIALNSVVIGDSIANIDFHAFYDCITLSDVYINNPSAWCKIDFIGYNSNPMSCAKRLHIVDKNGEEASSVVLDNSVFKIPSYAFKNCIGLESITISDSVTSIDSWAFEGCSSLESVIIPNSVTCTGGGVFRECSSLKSVAIGESVGSIGAEAFSNCESLYSIVIPHSVANIGSNVFYKCRGLTGIWVDDKNLDYSSDNRGVLFNKEKTELIQAPGGLHNAYVVPDSVASIEGYAFSNCGSLTSVTIGDIVIEIKIEAFADCDALTSVEIGNSVISIDNSAFSNCENLTSSIIGESVVNIGWSAFYGCSSLTTVTIPDSVLCVEDYAFSYCANLATVTIGSNVVSIGEDAFRNCISLVAIDLNNSVMTVGDDAFRNCTSLTTMTIGANVVSIGNYAYENCVSLKHITFEGDAPTIGNNSFYCVEAIIRYPKNNYTWTEDIRKNYGGTLNWIAYTSKEPISITIPGEEGTFTSFAGAMEAYDPATQYIKLTGDVEVELTMTKDLKIDLNGYSLTGVIDLNGNVVYGVDTSTDGYTAANAGYFNCVDEKGEPVVPAAHFKTDKATYGAVKRYLAVKDEKSYSFHRFYFGITHATLNTANGGIGYKAVFAGDEAVKAALGADGTYGIQLSLRADFDGCTSAAFPASEFPTDGKAQSRTLLLKNILEKGMTLEEMTANATMPIYARTCLATADGVVIQSSVFQITLQQMVQSMDESFTTFAPAQQLHLKAFYATYADLFKDWQLENI